LRRGRGAVAPLQELGDGVDLILQIERQEQQDKRQETEDGHPFEAAHRQTYGKPAAGDNRETPSRALARVCQRIGEMGKSELTIPEVRGQAKPGDKTMIDALEPAAVESERQSSASFDEALTAIAKAARIGMEKTREMVATVGKAKTLGERSLGHPDPGALSMSLILEFMAEYAAQKSDQNKP